LENLRTLRKLRRIRRRLSEYEGFAGDGIMALAGFQIDQLKPELRHQALAAIQKILETANEVFESLDALLIEYAKSNILADEVTDEEQQRNKDRLAQIRDMEGMIPGNWRGRKNKGKRH
jgi:hypothetical protein